jgi:hypothetical protein
VGVCAHVRMFVFTRMPCAFRFRDVDGMPHPSQRGVYPPQLTPEDAAQSESMLSAFRTRSSDPEEDTPGAGGDWQDVVVDSEGLARVCTAESLLPGTRYRFRIVFRPRLSKRYCRGWLPWEAVALSDWFRTDGVGLLPIPGSHVFPLVCMSVFVLPLCKWGWGWGGSAVSSLRGA